MQRSAEL